MDKVSFNANIRPVRAQEFAQLCEKLGKSSNVKYPWTVKQTVQGPAGYTKGVLDCTAGGIIDDDTGDVVMFHICHSMDENKNFSAIEADIMKRISSFSKNLKGFLVGSLGKYKTSDEMFLNFKNMFKKNGISTTFFRENKYDPTDILYNSTKDEIMITSYSISKKLSDGEKNHIGILNDCFRQIQIASGDEII